MDIIHIKRVGAIDAAIGFRLRQIRQSRNLSQRDVAERLGVTFQQIQKYEQGQTRISVAALILIANILKTHPADIIASIYMPHDPPEPVQMPTLDERAQLLWSRIKNVKHKRLVLDLMLSLLDQDKNPHRI